MGCGEEQVLHRWRSHPGQRYPVCGSDRNGWRAHRTPGNSRSGSGCAAANQWIVRVRALHRPTGMAAPAGSRSRIRKLEPVRRIPPGSRAAVRDDRDADPVVDACDSESQLRLGARHFWGCRSFASLATQPESNADQHEDESSSARTRGDPEAVQKRSTADAIRNHARVSGPWNEPVQLTVWMPPDVTPDADSLRSLFRVSEHD